MLSILGIGVNLPSNVCLLTIMRILFPMPPEPQSVIKKATSNGGIEEANLENIDGQIKQGKFSNFKNFLKNEPDAGLEPATVGLKVQRSTD